MGIENGELRIENYYLDQQIPISRALSCHLERAQRVERSPKHCNTEGDSSLTLRMTDIMKQLYKSEFVRRNDTGQNEMRND